MHEINNIHPLFDSLPIYVAVRNLESSKNLKIYYGSYNLVDYFNILCYQIIYHRQQIFRSTKVSQFTGFHPNVGKTWQILLHPY